MEAGANSPAVPSRSRTQPLINALKSAINFVSAPQYLVTAMLFLLASGSACRPLWTKKGGLFLLALVGGGIGLSFLDPNFTRSRRSPTTFRSSE